MGGKALRRTGGWALPCPKIPSTKIFKVVPSKGLHMCLDRAAVPNQLLQPSCCLSGSLHRDRTSTSRILTTPTPGVISKQATGTADGLTTDPLTDYVSSSRSIPAPGLIPTVVGTAACPFRPHIPSTLTSSGSPPCPGTCPHSSCTPPTLPPPGHPPS